MMQDISNHIIDIVQNSIVANANNIVVMIYQKDDVIGFWVEDDGVGMSEAFILEVTDPFVSTRKTRKIGLGLPLLKMSTNYANGSLTIESIPNGKTKVHATWQKSHIDTPPWGPLDECWMSCYLSFQYKVLSMIFVKEDQRIELNNEQLWNQIQERDYFYDLSILVYIKQQLQTDLKQLDWSTS